MKKYGLFSGLLLGTLLMASQAMALVAPPASITMPPSPDADGTFQIKWTRSTTPGAVSVLEEATNPAFTGATVVYTGTGNYTTRVKTSAAATYYYRVRATKAGDPDGPSAYTVGASGVEVSNRLPAPTSISAPATDVDGSYTVVVSRLPSGTSYVIEESINGGAFAEIYVGTTYYKAVKNGATPRTYTYQARARKTGSVDSSPTAQVNVVVFAFTGSATLATTYPTQGAAWTGSSHSNPNNQGPGSGSCIGCHSPTGEKTASLAGIVSCEGCHGIAPGGVLPNSSIAAFDSCAKCHNSHYSATTSIASDFSASAHGTTPYAPEFGTDKCVVCHNPHTANVPTSTICVTCHSGAHVAHQGTLPDCTNCHAAHSLSLSAGASAAYHAAVSNTASSAFCGTCHSNAPHYGGTAFHKAQYVSDASLPVSCSSCHGNPVNTSVNAAILVQFAGSAHGNPAGEAWRHFDWRSASRAACARCHAGTAFVAKLDNENSSTNVYQATDVLKAGEVLNCSACHTDAGTGTLRRTSEAFTINITNGTVSYDVDGASTLCARCHSGRETGDSIKNDPSTTGVRGFIASHYLAAAGTLYNLGGYEYDTTYNTLGSHKGIGTGTDEEGPCVTCHMPGKNHTFVAGSSAVCTSCHADTAATLAAAKASYDTALNTLKLALEAKGIHYASTHPNFFTTAYVVGGVNAPVTNWAVPYGAVSWKNTMGAAFNYYLLVNEPGAYIHNYAYAMKLIDDSIDFLNDGVLNDNGL